MPTQQEITRSMPFSNDAEKGVLSCFFHNPADLLPDAQSSIPEEAFYHAANRLLYEVMLEFSAGGKRPVEYIALSQHLQDKGLMEKIGGQGVLAELLDFVPAPTHYGYYKGILIDKWNLRRIIALCQDGLTKAYEFQEEGARALVAELEAGMFDLMQDMQTCQAGHAQMVDGKDAAREWLDHQEQVYKNRGKVSGVTTGIHEIDLTLHGVDDGEGEVCTIAGRPAMGKTAKAVTIIEHNIELGVPGAIFSIEMSRNQLQSRLYLGACGVDTSKAITGMYSRGELRDVTRKAGEMGMQPWSIMDHSGMTTADLRAQVQMLKRKKGIRWIVVDHLHLLQPVTKKGQADERGQLVEAMETLHLLKKQFNLAIFLLVQMDRASDKKAHLPPTLSDLSGSASIEQYSDHVIFIARPSVNYPWHKLKEEAQAEWIEGHREQRLRNPDRWSEGLKYPDLKDEKGNHISYAREDYEEHTVLHVKKNRRGPSPELSVRFRAELTRFQSRQRGLYSNNAADRQLGYEPKVAAPLAESSAPPAPEPVATGKAAPESQAHLKCPKPEVQAQEPELPLPEGHEPGEEDDRAER